LGRIAVSELDDAGIVHAAVQKQTSASQGRSACEALVLVRFRTGSQ